MIKILPSILALDSLEFTKQLTNLSVLDEIDIDISTHPFTEKSTLNLDESLNLLQEWKKKITFHLMEENPSKSISSIIKSDLIIERIYIHQESRIKFLEDLDKNTLNKLGITIKRESWLKDVEFYKQFASVQLMTGSFGAQGNDFDEDALSKSLELRELGYEGEIGIDGGVNLRSAKIIKNYPINRVSVGSFFSKSKNVELDKMKLDLALNMQTEEDYQIT